jgi:hypothetical protein
MEAIKRWAKRVVHAPENAPPTVSAKDWFKENVDSSPTHAVRTFFLLSSLLSSHIPPGG